MCICWKHSNDPEGIKAFEKTFAETPLLLRPLLFGFKREKITNERLIRDAEADCDKINSFYRTPCHKEIVFILCENLVHNGLKPMQKGAYF